MESSITQLGIGGVFAILVIREVLNFLKSRKETNGSSQPPPWADLLVARVREIYVSHDKLELAIERIAEAQVQQTALMKQLVAQNGAS